MSGRHIVLTANSLQTIGRLWSRGLPPAVGIVLFLAAAGAARAQGLCADIRSLIDHARSGFAAIADPPKGGTGERAVTLTLAGASSCRVTKQSKREVYRCAWEISHRAERAYDTFDAFVLAIEECIGEQAVLHRDRSVNHPDYYASRRFETARAEVSVSVKDKGALGSTFVFISVRGTPEK